jgi:hypothetical protein
MFSQNKQVERSFSTTTKRKQMLVETTARDTNATPMIATNELSKPVRLGSYTSYLTQH